MRRALVILATALGLIAVACSSDSIQTTPLGSAALPAPTLVGVQIEIPTSEVQAQAVVVGVPIGQALQVRALPGLDQPVAGEAPAGTGVDLLGLAFETEDELTWWQVEADGVQGWIDAAIAYRGSTQNITDQVLTSLGDTTFASGEDAARAIAQQIVTQGSSEVILVAKNEVAGTGSTTITADVLGSQDDAVVGIRLIIATSAATNWRPASVLQAQLCVRGVNADGLCS